MLLIPTATDDLLGGEKRGAGSTVVALNQEGPGPNGVLANDIWSFTGSDDRSDIRSTFVQPFLSYATGEATHPVFAWASPVGYSGRQVADAETGSGTSEKSRK
ncbi:hypothetical protein EV132_102180 [Rhizobium sullae]|uniref:Uncharacterized protein n=1 Tax=Rhizobium sullae TaxID=50338 RepID=A0A4R3QGV2_RHISU|nr:hypothetical protein EV132_102180 [Rhizobium sullae]